MQNNIEERNWFLIDAKGVALGRTATAAADLLRGKKKVNFAPHTDTGDFVVIINAESYLLTGKKEDQKRYYKHTGYLGNMKTFTVKDLKETKPGDIMKRAIYGMLPSNLLRDGFMARLKIFVGDHNLGNIKFKNQE